MAERQLLVRIIGDSSSLERSFARTSRKTQELGVSMTALSKTTGGFSRGFLSGAGALSSFGGALALTSGSFFAGAGIVAGLGAATNAAGNLEQTLNVLGAVTDATAGDLKAASAAAINLGNDISLPAVSANDAATAMLQLAKGGLTVEQAMNAARGTLQLAAAAQTDVGTAANITARAITSFGLAGDQATRIADALANAASSATGDITDFALGLQQSSATARSFGLSAQQTVAALTVLAQAGITGSDAGTSLRVMLTRLLPSSKAAAREINQLGVSVKDASGQFLPFREIIERYNAALLKLAPAERQRALQTIFGTDAQRAATFILGQSVDVYDRAATAVGKQGGAAKQAAALNKGYKGSLDALASSLSGTATVVGQKLIPGLTTANRAVAGFIADLNKGNFDEVKSKLAGLGSSFRDAASRLGNAFQARMEEIDWSAVGKAIGDGIAKGVAAATGVAKALANRFMEAFRTIDFNALGRAAGPGLAAALVSAFATLTDPAFWIKNWDLALAVGLTVFGGSLAKAVGKLAAPITRIFGGVFLEGFVRLERVAPRLAENLFRAIIHDASATVRLIEGLFSRLISSLTRRISRPLRFVVKVLGIQAAINAVVSAFQRIGAFIGHVLDAAFTRLKIEAVKAVLGIIDPFTHLPEKLGGGPFQDLKDKLHEMLDGLQGDGRIGGGATGQAIVNGMATSIKNGQPTIQTALDALLQGVQPTKPIETRNFTAGFSGDGRDVASAGETTPPPRRRLTADQRNTFFDNDVARIIMRGGLGTIQEQIAALERANRLIETRIKVTKDVTRRLHLEDEVLQNAATIKSLKAQQAADALQARQDAVDEVIARLRLKVDAAQLTAGFGDDLRSLQALKTGILAEIKEFGATAELLGDLASAKQQIAQTKQQQISAKEFFTLGLGPTGEDRIPTATNLRKRLGTLTEAVRGTTLDTPALEKRLAAIRKVLSQKIIPDDVRSKIDQWFKELRQSFDKGVGDVTKFRHVDSNKILAGLGLSPDQIRQLRGRIDQIGAGGLVPGRGSLAFAAAGAGGTVPSSALGPVSLRGSGIGGNEILVMEINGREIGRVTRRENQKTDRTRTRSRRG